MPLATVGRGQFGRWPRMMLSKLFEDSEHNSSRHRTKRELFLEKMDKLVPWALLVDLGKGDTE